MRKFLWLAIIVMISCSETSELPEEVLLDVNLRGDWTLVSHTVLNTNEGLDCNFDGATMNFNSGSKVTRSHRTNCDERTESGNHFLNAELKTMVFQTYVIDVLNFELNSERMSFEYEMDLNVDGNVEMIREVYSKD